MACQENVFNTTKCDTREHTEEHLHFAFTYALSKGNTAQLLHKTLQYLKPCSHFVCFVFTAHTVYLCVLCVSENKQRLFHCRTLTDWFL
jgi:hypothetical protein